MDSVAAKVAQLAMRKNLPDHIILTGGLSSSEYFTKILSEKIGQKYALLNRDDMQALWERHCWQKKRQKQIKGDKNGTDQRIARGI